jgi:protoheme IX farnesyltransferase
MKAAVTVCSEAAAPLKRPHRVGAWSGDPAPTADHSSTAAVWPRLADYVQLTKPRIAILVLFTVAAGALLAGGLHVNGLVLFHVLFGTALVAAGASALNQFIERRSDARMARTENRPLPAGRLSPAEALLFGAALGLGGVAYLALTLPWAAAVVAAATFALYVGVYTPLKPRTTLNTLVGAVSGALPPLIGWAAVRGGLTREALPLFLIVFLWQLPHFLAIAWVYRDQYAAAGLRMQPVADRTGRGAGWRMVGWCLALVPASLAPLAFGAGPAYAVGAVLLGLGFLASAVGFLGGPSVPQARRVLRVSLFYLPGVFALMLLDAAIR